MAKKLFYITIALFYFLDSNSQETSNYKASILSTLNGLSNNRVNSICKDYLGYLWVGTNHGLNRYDGYEIINYYSESESNNSISGNDIIFIYEDDYNNLWVSTINGLNKYNRTSNDFTRYNFDINSLIFYAAYEDEDFVYFSSNTWGLTVYDKKNKQFINQKYKQLNSNSYEMFGPNKIQNIDDDNIVVVAHNIGLSKINLKKKEASLLKSISNKIVDFLVLPNEIWVSLGENGFKIINRDSMEEVDISLKNPLISKISVLDISRNPKTNNIWLLTDGDGILIVNESFDIIATIKKGLNVNNVLSDNSITNVLFDGDIVWLGTVRSGIIKLVPSIFNHFKYQNGTIYGTSEKAIISFCEDKQNENYLWIGTDGGGLNKLDLKANTFEHFITDETKSITAVVNFDANNLLIGSYAEGLYFFNKKNKQFSSVENHSVLKKIKTKTYYKLFRDSYNNIWISYRDGDLWKLSLKNNNLEKINNYKNRDFFSDLKPNFYSACNDNEGNIWFASINGIFIYNTLDSRLEKKVLISNNVKNYGRNILAIVADNFGNIIFGTDKGVYKYDVRTEKVSEVFVNNAEFSRIYHTLYVDSDNNIWTATSNGLFLLYLDDNDKQLIQFGNELNFDYRFISKASNGEVYAGGDRGVIRFKPDLYTTQKEKTNVVITSLISGGNQTNSKSMVLANDVTDYYETSVPYSATVYNFKFNAFNYLSEGQVKYQYQLENFENIWHDGSNRSATYEALSPGDYIFKVKAANGNGIWGIESTKIKLTITPLWWQTLWFKILMILLFLAAISYVWLESLSRAKLQHQLKMEINEQHRIKENNQLKLLFFTNISHELKTPLTLIYSPLEQLIKRSSDLLEVKKMLPFIYRNAKRMNILIEELLELRQSDVSKLTLNRKKSDLIKNCKEVISHFDHQSRMEDIKINIKTNLTKLDFFYDLNRMNKILFNLLSNALKHTDAGGEINIHLSKTNNEVEIIVSDTGVGISKENQSKIFDLYHHVGYKLSGNGIGLTYTKTLVELHKGTIRVESAPNQGAKFIINLPIIEEDIENINVQNPVIEDEILQINEPIYVEKVEHDNNTPLILIVDDEWDLRNYIESIISPMYRVIVANNGKTALKKAIEYLPDLIISDVMMPVMNGLEFCTKVKENLRINHTPIILLTAKGTVKSQMEGYGSGADSYIPKPFNNELLIGQIKSLLHNRKLLLKRFHQNIGMSVYELPQNALDEKFIQRLVNFIDINIENPNLNVSSIVNEMGVSRTILYLKTKAITGKTLNDFILRVRLQKAVDLLKNTNKSIKDVAFCCGFSSPTYFSVVFKKYYKKSPSNFRILKE